MRGLIISYIICWMFLFGFMEGVDTSRKQGGWIATTENIMISFFWPALIVAVIFFPIKGKR